MDVPVADAITPKARAAHFHPGSLDALNFLLSDVRGALGPYLNVFLVTQQHWSQAGVGLVTLIGGWLSLAVQPLAGAIIDATHSKRALIVAALIVLAAGAVAIFAMPTFWPVMIANSAIAVVGDFFGPSSGDHPWNLSTKPIGPANGPKRGLRSRRECRHRGGRGQGGLGVFAVRCVPAG